MPNLELTQHNATIVAAVHSTQEVTKSGGFHPIISALVNALSNTPPLHDKNTIYLHRPQHGPVQIVEPYTADLELCVDDSVQLFYDKDVFFTKSGFKYHNQPAVALTKKKPLSHSPIIALLYPKPLQVMPYLRAGKEAIFIAIPWLGFIISVVILSSVLLTARKKSEKPLLHKPLKFTFGYYFHTLNLLVSSYPLVLLFLNKTPLIGLSIPIFYLLLVSLNVCATYARNTKVRAYNQTIVQQILKN